MICRIVTGGVITQKTVTINLTALIKRALRVALSSLRVTVFHFLDSKQL